jgi:hypothetical protein
MGGAYMVCGMPGSFLCHSLKRPFSPRSQPAQDEGSRIRVDHWCFHFFFFDLTLSVEASLFLITTQLRKVFIQRFPPSFVLVGLGGIGASYYGNKYYRAVVKGEHVRRFERQK